MLLALLALALIAVVLATPLAPAALERWRASARARAGGAAPRIDDWRSTTPAASAAPSSAPASSCAPA